MRYPQLILLALALLSGAIAGPLELSLVPPDHPVAIGSTSTIDLMILNRGPDDQAFTAPTALLTGLSAGAQSWRVELRAAAAIDATDTVASGHFATRTYRLTLPADAQGKVIIEARLGGFTPVRGVIEIESRAVADTAVTAPTEQMPASAVRQPTTNLARAEPAASIIQRTFANRLAPHEPVYFIHGDETPAAKFQFSFKYKLLNFTDISSGSMARTLQFAFTQRSLWDISSASSPFYDTSYMPELIFESLAPKPEEKDTWLTWLGYQAAFKHESNGRDGPVSRSLNTVYFRPVFAIGALDGWHVLFIPEIFAYISSLEDNTDLDDYRGYGQLRVVLGRNDGPSLMLSAWAGKSFKHRTLQLDFTLPIRTRLLDFETYLLVQYFNGYGESLLSYRDKSETLRAGVSLVR